MLHTKLANFIIFQAAWFAAVILHNNLGALICVILALINCFQLRVIFGAILVSLIGIFNDYLLLYFNIITFPGQSFMFLPLWLIALWFAFASTLHSSLAWLNKISLLNIALLGGIGGAISYLAGAKLGAIEYDSSVMPAFAWHFLNWFVLLPVIVKIKFSKLCRKL